MFSKFFRAPYLASSRLVNQSTASRPVIMAIRKFSTIDHYSVLGVERDASPAEIKEAYFALAKKLHPDVGGEPADFRRLYESYKALSQKIKTVSHAFSRNPYGEKKRYHPDENRNFNNAAFEGMIFFNDLERLLVEKYSKSSYLKLLIELGQKRLCRILQSSDDIALLMTNVLEKDRRNLIDLIGKDHIANVLDLRDLFAGDFTYAKVRTNSKIIFNRCVLQWGGYKQLFNILGQDTVLKCLKGDNIGFLLWSIRSSFSKKECDYFIDFLEKKDLNKYINTHYYSLNGILENVSEEKQKEVLNNLEPSYFTLKYKFLHCVTDTLKLLYPSNHQLFLDILGKNNLDALMTSPKMDHRHIENFESVIKKQEKENEEHYPRLRL